MPDVLSVVADDYFVDLYRSMPGRATEAGIHDYDGELGDFSEAAVSGFVRRLKDHLARAARLDARELTLREQNDLALLRSDMETTLIWYERLAGWRRNPDFYPSTALYALYLLCVRDFAPVEERMRSLSARLRAVPAFLDTAARTLRNPPSIFTVLAIESAEGAVEFFQGQVPSFAKQVPPLESELLSANAAALVALTNYIDFLKTKLLPRSRGRFPVGKDLFERILRVEHMVDLSAEDLADLGRQVFEETKVALKMTAAAIDLNKGWATLVHELRGQHPAGELVLEAYRSEITRLHEFIVDRDIVSFPTHAVLEVVPTPPFARSSIPYAAYMSPAAFEQAQTGQFWVTPVNTSIPPAVRQAQLEEHNFFSIPLTAIHEAYPGHHIQLVTSNQASDRIRKHFSCTTFVEGWALYCEQMMFDQGYLADTRARLFQLKDQLWRAARVIIDVALQTGTMTPEEAVRLLVEEVHLSEAAARSEVRRYAMTPTQPMSYTLGKLEIVRLRREYGHMPLRQFHDRLLGCGSVPPSIARRELAAEMSVDEGQSETTGIA